MVSHWLGYPPPVKGGAGLGVDPRLRYWTQQDLDAGAPPPEPGFPPG